MTSIEEKIQFVRQPVQVKALMTDWYQTQQHPMEARGLDPRMMLVPELVFGKSFWKAVTVSESGGKKELWIQEYEDGSLKVDWETDVIYNPMRWEEFLKEKPTTALTFRVYVGWDDYYLYQHRDRKKFQSFKIEGQRSLISDLATTAYMKRNGSAAEQMMILIRRYAANPNDPRTFPVLPFLVSVRYDKSPEGHENLVIEKLVSPSWIVFEK